MSLKCFGLIVLLCTLTNSINGQLASPCPTILSYESRDLQDDRWFAVLTFESDEDLTGLYINIVLDRPALILGNWIGEITSTDNKEFLIQDRKYKIRARNPFQIRFFVRFNKAEPIPSVNVVRFNGKTVCSRNFMTPTVIDEINRVETSGIVMRPTSTRRPTSSPNHGSNNYYDNEEPSNNRRTSTSRPIQSSNHDSDNYYDNEESSNNRRTSTTRRTTTRRTTTTRRPITLIDDRPEDEYRGDNSNSNSDSRRTTRRPYVTDNRRTTSRINLDPGSQGHDSRVPSTTSSSVPAGYPLSGENPGREPITGFNTEDFGHQNNNKLSSPDDDSDDYFHGDFHQTVGSSQNKPQTSSGSQTTDGNEACGIVTLTPSPLVARGEATRPGQWPWHASLYHSKGLQLQYICGGTLITNEHVVTAAHCVTKPSSERVVDKGNLLVYLGKHTLISFGPEVQDRNVAEITVHPEYNATSYFNDIAIIKLSSPARITSYVRTCCLWQGDSDVESVENKVGTVVGWGFDENKKLSNKLMQAQMPVVPTIKCIYSNREFFLRYTFEKNFCAGFRNGTSVCNGDSGGGLLFPKRGTSGAHTVWQLRGLVSIGVALQGQGVCDTSQYIVFTDVAKFTHWIRQVISY